MLTLNRARTFRASWLIARVGAVVTLSAITLTSAYADTLAVGGCVGGQGAVSCVVRVGPGGDPYVRTVPQPVGEEAKAQLSERDRRWMDRCRPVIVQDRYGVPRYHYAAPGCEFGVIE